MVIRMDKVKNNSLHIMIVWFLSYNFFINKFVSNKLMINLGVKALFPIIIIELLFPCILLLYKPLKRIQKEKLTKLAGKNSSVYFVFKIFISLYLLITSILVLRHICTFLTTYYFNIISLSLEILLLLGVVLYSSKNNFKVLSTISVLVTFYTIIEFIVYIITGVESRWYLINIIPSYNLSEIIKIVVYLSLFIIDFILLFLHGEDCSETIKKKHLILFSFILAFINIFEKIKMCVSLGPLISMVNYPSFEVWRLSSIVFIRQNLDFIPLIGWIMIAFVRLSLSTYLIDKVWETTNYKFNIIVLFVIGVLTYIICNNLEISILIEQNAYIFVFTVGIISFILLLSFFKRRVSNVK